MAKSKAVAERDEARADLLALLKPGDAVYTVLRHVSRSGMYRVLDVFIIRDNKPRRISWTVSRALGWRYDARHDGVGVGGAGMDMGFHLVYSLGLALFGSGDACAALGYHVGRNGDTGPETEGGYLLNQRWL
jgi:hypothetical protein